MAKSTPYRTTVVRNMDLVRNSDIHKEWAMNLILAALVDHSFLESTGNKPRLTNDDVGTLVAGRVADATIVRIIESYKGEYQVSAHSISDLRRRGVGEKVIEAMVLKELNSTSSERRDCPQYPMATGREVLQINDGHFAHQVGRSKSHGARVFQASVQRGRGHGFGEKFPFLAVAFSSCFAISPVGASFRAARTYARWNFARLEQLRSEWRFS